MGGKSAPKREPVRPDLTPTVRHRDGFVTPGQYGPEGLEALRKLAKDETSTFYRSEIRALVETAQIQSLLYRSLRDLDERIIEWLKANDLYLRCDREAELWVLRGEMGPIQEELVEAKSGEAI